MRTARAIVYDLGNVLVDIDFRRVFAFWASCGHRSVAELEALFKMGSAYQAHERGELETEDYWASLRKELGLDLSDEQLAAGWSEIFCGSDPALPELLLRRAKQQRQAVLSNTNAPHLRSARALYPDLFSSMERVFASHELAARKPEPIIYAKVTEALALSPEAILFLDDNDENLRAAARFGWQVQCISSSRALAQWLQRPE